MTRVPFTALIPCAGFSSRMGEFKPLLPIGGMPMIARTVSGFLEAGAKAVLIVTGYRGQEVRRALSGVPGLLFAENPLYRRTGMLESIQAGLPELLEQSPSPYVFLTPGDIPLVSPETLSAMLQEAGKGAMVIRPSLNGRAGHPLLLSRIQAEQLQCYRGTDGLKSFLRSRQEETAFVNVQDPGILLDADTPEDYRRLLSFERGEIR